MIPFLDLFGQYSGIRGEIDAAIAQVLHEAAFINGPAVQSFERDFAGYQQAAHCVGVANGTDAIEIALEALQLPPDSEVIVPANSFIASSEAVTRTGHRVVFADVDPDSYLLDLADVERRITPETRAVICVHLHGNPCDMDAVLTLARHNDLAVIEDCAQAHGAEWQGRRVGAIGHIGTFSFYPGKNLGAYGDAGAIVTNDEALAHRCRTIANHGRESKYLHLIEGRNSRLDTLQAAVLRVKLRHLDSWVNRRNSVAHRYLDGLAGVEDVILPVVRDRTRHVFHLFVIRSKQRDALAAHLASCGIQTGIHYPIALPSLPAYAHLPGNDQPMVATRLAEEVLSLPVGDHMTDGDADVVVDAVRTFLGKPPSIKRAINLPRPV